MQPLGFALEVPFVATVRTLGEPGGSTAEQDADQKYRKDHKEQRHPERLAARLRLGSEGIEVDCHRMSVGQGKDDQHHAQRHQHEPAHNAFDHDLPLDPTDRTLALAIDPLADFLAGLELGNVFFAHFHLLAGTRIAAETGRPVLD